MDGDARCPRDSRPYRQLRPLETEAIQQRAGGRTLCLPLAHKWCRRPCPLMARAAPRPADERVHCRARVCKRSRPPPRSVAGIPRQADAGVLCPALGPALAGRSFHPLHHWMARAIPQAADARTRYRVRPRKSFPPLHPWGTKALPAWGEAGICPPLACEWCPHLRPWTAPATRLEAVDQRRRIFRKRLRHRRRRQRPPTTTANLRCRNCR